MNVTGHATTRTVLWYAMQIYSLMFNRFKEYAGEWQQAQHLSMICNASLLRPPTPLTHKLTCAPSSLRFVPRLLPEV